MKPYQVANNKDGDEAIRNVSVPRDEHADEHSEEPEEEQDEKIEELKQKI